MDPKSSYTKIENDLVPGFRQRLNSAEGAEDAQHIFAAFVQDILSKLVGAAVVLDEGDVRVDPELKDGFALGPGIAQNPDFAKFLEHTDLNDILRREGREAARKVTYMRTHPVRNETVLFPRKDRRP